MTAVDEKNEFVQFANNPEQQKVGQKAKKNK